MLAFDRREPKLRGSREREDVETDAVDPGDVRTSAPVQDDVSIEIFRCQSTNGVSALDDSCDEAKRKAGSLNDTSEDGATSHQTSECDLVRCRSCAASSVTRPHAVRPSDEWCHARGRRVHTENDATAGVAFSRLRHDKTPLARDPVARPMNSLDALCTRGALDEVVRPRQFCSDRTPRRARERLRHSRTVVVGCRVLRPGVQLNIRRRTYLQNLNFETFVASVEAEPKKTRSALVERIFEAHRLGVDGGDHLPDGQCCASTVCMLASGVLPDRSPRQNACRCR